MMGAQGSRELAEGAQLPRDTKYARTSMPKTASPISSPAPVRGEGEMPGLRMTVSNPRQESQGRMPK